MSLDIKICGLSTRESLDVAIRGGATHVGFIFFAKSPRNVSISEARMLANHAGDMATKVAVTVNETDEVLDRIVSEVRPDMLQLHGSESPQRALELKERFGLPIMKAFAVRSLGDIEAADVYEGVVDRVLFDAKPPVGSELPGGNGVSFDWNLLRNRKTDVRGRNGKAVGLPYMLSGGLDAANIIHALEISGAKAIDVSSGVERSPGVKDPDKIREFLMMLATYNVSEEPANA